MWSAANWTERARVGVDGLPGRRDAAADGHGGELVANGGAFIEPRVVRAFIQDGHRTDVPHKVLRRAITARHRRDADGDHGAGRRARHGEERAQIPGYTIAGKTGTAHKLVNGRYSTTDYNASFVGFLPSRNPAVAIIVVIDSPHGPNGYYGGTRLGADLQADRRGDAPYLGVGPTLNPQPPGAGRSARIEATRRR